MIIQCEKCSTKFRLDDSRVTDAGVRVRCSRCSHTFVVRREPVDDTGDFDAMLDGLLGDSARPGDDLGSTGAEQDVQTESAVPEEYALDRDPVAVQEAGAVVSDNDAAANSGSFGEFLRQNTGLPQFQSPAAAPGEESQVPCTLMETQEGSAVPESSKPPAGADSSETPEVSADHQVQVSVEGEAEDWLGVSAPSQGEGTDVDCSPASDPVQESLSDAVCSADASLRREIWPVADGKPSGEDELPPLSIASRRKGSPMVPVVLGIGLLVTLAGALFYLVSDRLTGFIPDSVVQSIGIARKPAGGAVIRSLEGHFLVNKQAGELFVMRGEVVNVSEKPLSTLRIRGTLYGAGGEIIAQRTVYCGNDLAPADLAFNSYTSIERSMGRMLDADLSNLEVPPGKAIPFVLVFKGVSSKATQFEASLVSPENE